MFTNDTTVSTHNQSTAQNRRGSSGTSAIELARVTLQTQHGDLVIYYDQSIETTEGKRAFRFGILPRIEKVVS